MSPTCRLASALRRYCTPGFVQAGACCEDLVEEVLYRGEKDPAQ